MVLAAAAIALAYDIRVQSLVSSVDQGPKTVTRRRTYIWIRRKITIRPISPRIPIPNPTAGRFSIANAEPMATRFIAAEAKRAYTNSTRVPPSIWLSIPKRGRRISLEAISYSWMTRARSQDRRMIRRAGVVTITSEIRTANTRFHTLAERCQTKYCAAPATISQRGSMKRHPGTRSPPRIRAETAPCNSTNNSFRCGTCSWSMNSRSRRSLRRSDTGKVICASAAIIAVAAVITPSAFASRSKAEESSISDCRKDAPSRQDGEFVAAHEQNLPATARDRRI